VVTSPTGAAIRDFLNVLHRRHPGIRVVINPVRVQGKGAAAEIRRAIEEFGQWKTHGLPAVDVIVVTRGGGSLEDLWEFNEEIVARAIAASPIPVVSAVGHEIDFTIADFAADLRAPTPSAAAELLAADRLAVLDRLRQQQARLTGLARGRVDLLRARLGATRQSPLFREPARRLEEYQQTLDRLGEGLAGGAQRLIERRRNALAATWHRLAARSPAQALRDVRHATDLHHRRLGEITRQRLADLRSRFDQHAATLRALNPDATLARGFTITLDAAGRPVVSAHTVRPGAQLRIRFADGTVDTTAA
jgi:exodeoxyribonuclease VII large subunit